jgi:serine/threonine-protein kinase
MSEEGFGTETRLMIDWLTRYFLPVLDGVEAIHGHGVVHRDLKPENVLMDGETPKIADFGLARSLAMRTVSDSWEVKGTMAYMAPEQFMDFRRTGVEADIYSLGKILFEAVQGRIDPKGLPFKSVQLENPSTAFLIGLDQIIRKATSEDKTERYGSVALLRSAILDAIDNAAKPEEVSPASRADL